MSAASSLLRQGKTELLSSLIKHQQCQIDRLFPSHLANRYNFRKFATSEARSRKTSPAILAEACRSVVGASCVPASAGSRCFTTSPLGKSPMSTAPDSSFFPGKVIKLSFVALTAAAVSAAVYWALEETVFKGYSREVKSMLPPEGWLGPEKIQHLHQSKEGMEGIPKMIERRPVVAGGAESMHQVTDRKPIVATDTTGGMDRNEEVIEETESKSQVTGEIERDRQIIEETERRPLVLAIKGNTTEDRTVVDIQMTESPKLVEYDVPSNLHEEGGETADQEIVSEREAQQLWGQPDDEFPQKTAGELPSSYQEEKERNEEEIPEQSRTDENSPEEHLDELTIKVLHIRMEDEDEENVNMTVESASSGAHIIDEPQVPERVTAEEDYHDPFPEDFLPNGHEVLRQDKGEMVVETMGDSERQEVEESNTKGHDQHGPQKNQVLEEGDVDLAGATHDAEMRQAETGARAFEEDLSRLKEEHEHVLKEVQAENLRLTVYASRLEKDLDMEKQRAEDRLQQQQQRAEERLHSELKCKDDEAKREVEEMELFTKAHTIAAVTREKAKHLEDTRDLQTQVEALYKAYYVQSEEAKVGHTTHKLAMGAFAFEDAMLRGVPVEKEVQLLLEATGGQGCDKLVEVALLSLPEDTVKKGPWTYLQLQEEFVSLEGSLRELSLIPAAGQGGLFTHLVARIASTLKVREEVGGQGVEATISKVERCLAERKLVEAVDVLARGLEGTKAENLVARWTEQARRRVIAEQALTMIQAHAIVIASSLA